MAEIVPKSQLFVYMFKFRHFHRICLGSSYAHAKNQGDPMSNSWVNAPQFSDTWSYDTQGGRAKSKTLLWYNIHWYTGKRHPKIFLRAMTHDTQEVEPWPSHYCDTIYTDTQGKRHPKIFLRAMIHDTQGVEPSAHPPLALRWPRPPRASPSAGHSLRRPRPPPARPLLAHRTTISWWLLRYT